MNTVKKSILGALVLAIAAVPFAQDEQFAATYALKGKKLPAISLHNINGKTITNKDLLGKVTVIDVFATWCGPCRAAAPKLDVMYKEFSGKGLQIIGVNAGEREGGKPISFDAYMKVTKDYVAEHKYSYTFATAADDAAKSLNVMAFPSFFIVDKKGNIAEVMVGFDEAGMRAKIKSLL